MLRIQRVCGKSRGGASVPLCVKLKGAVVCGGNQRHNSGTGCTWATGSLEQSDAEENQQSGRPDSSVCKSNGLNPDEPCPGKVFF